MTNTKRADRKVEELAPIRSLWTNVATGQQIIVTKTTHDWVSFIGLDLSHGGMTPASLVEHYVKAGNNCRIQARAI